MVATPTVNGGAARFVNRSDALQHATNRPRDGAGAPLNSGRFVRNQATAKPPGTTGAMAAENKGPVSGSAVKRAVSRPSQMREDAQGVRRRLARSFQPRSMRWSQDVQGARFARTRWCPRNRQEEAMPVRAGPSHRAGAGTAGKGRWRLRGGAERIRGFGSSRRELANLAVARVEVDTTGRYRGGSSARSPPLRRPVQGRIAGGGRARRMVSSAGSAWPRPGLPAVTGGPSASSSSAARPAPEPTRDCARARSRGLPRQEPVRTSRSGRLMKGGGSRDPAAGQSLDARVGRRRAV